MDFLEILNQQVNEECAVFPNRRGEEAENSRQNRCQNRREKLKKLTAPVKEGISIVKINKKTRPRMGYRSFSFGLQH